MKKETNTNFKNLELMEKLFDTDYVLFDKANDTLVRFTNGKVIIYSDIEEAEIDCYGNEYVTRCTDLPEHHQEDLLTNKN